MTASASGRWSFLPPLLAFSAVCGLVLYLVAGTAHWSLGSMHLIMLGYFTLISAALHYWQEGSLITAPKEFVNRFMGGLVIKMMVTLLVLIVAVVKLPKELALVFALPFMGLYLAFLSFSTIRLTARLKRVGK